MKTMAAEKTLMSSLKKQIGCCGIGIVMGIVLSFVAYDISTPLPRSKFGLVPGRPMRIDPQKFLVVVFPKVSDKVHRGVLLTLDEFSQQEIEVFTDGKPVKMDAALFSAVPSEEEEKAYVEELNREFRRPGPLSHLRRLSFVIDRKTKDDEPIVKIVVHNRMEHASEYLYRVTAEGTVAPIMQLGF